ncbi:MAG TPA: hypothetical protein VFD69_12925 [Vicinamibacterales bacterium]|jgi:hypothetical protein|nr:hypothetical protein [Vicinamibacterales bacterium]
MKGTIVWGVAAAVLAVVGVVSLRIATVERLVADAQQDLATLNYERAEQSLAEAEESIGVARWVPGFGSSVMDEVRARRGALQYWQRKYDTLLPEGEDPVTAIEEGSLDLKLVVANAVYRQNQGRYKDREVTKQALEESAAAYFAVLKNSAWREDAAYNYEYLIRLRDEQAKGKQPPQGGDASKGEMGQGGQPSEATSQKGFQIYIPLESQEKPLGGDAGKAPGKDRKG